MSRVRTDGGSLDPPQTRYARNGDLRLAYQVLGDGPIDIVLVPAFLSNIELGWDLRLFRAFQARLASFSRLIMFDRRGCGMSDGAAGVPLDEQVDDVRAVIDAAGAEQPVLLSALEGCSLSALFAASHPALVRALVMVTPVPRPLTGPGYEWAQTAKQRAAVVNGFLEQWGMASPANPLIAQFATDAGEIETWARWQRLSIGPAGAAAAFAQLGEMDVRHVLPSVQCPTLVLRPGLETFWDERHTGWVVDHTPGAQFLEFPGKGPIWDRHEEEVADAIQHFLTGARPPTVSDRVLATVLFTDIVGSTERAAALGDGAWRALLARHDTVIREEVERHRGRVVKSLGDGVLAVFDGPSRAITGATVIRERLRELGLEIRAGLHTGECELFGDDDIGGLAVHIGARISSLADPSEVLVSSTVRDLSVGSGQTLTDRGEHGLKGVPGVWRLYAVAA